MRDEIILALLDEVHPEVPKFALGTMPRMSYRWAHPVGLLNPWKMRDPRFIPERFKGYVCFGSRDYETELHSGFSHRRGTPVCKSCDLPPLYLFYYCINCGKPFIRDFSSTQFCEGYPHCYDCLGELKWGYCKDHPIPIYVRRYQLTGETVIKKPSGLSPKIYSEQEISDAFAFLNE